MTPTDVVDTQVATQPDEEMADPPEEASGEVQPPPAQRRRNAQGDSKQWS